MSCGYVKPTGSRRQRVMLTSSPHEKKGIHRKIPSCTMILSLPLLPKSSMFCSYALLSVMAYARAMRKLPPVERRDLATFVRPGSDSRVENSQSMVVGDHFVPLNSSWEWFIVCGAPTPPRSNLRVGIPVGIMASRNPGGYKTMLPGSPVTLMKRGIPGPWCRSRISALGSWTQSFIGARYLCPEELLRRLTSSGKTATLIFPDGE